MDIKNTSYKKHLGSIEHAHRRSRERLFNFIDLIDPVTGERQLIGIGDRGATYRFDNELDFKRHQRQLIKAGYDQHPALFAAEHFSSPNELIVKSIDPNDPRQIEAIELRNRKINQLLDDPEFQMAVQSELMDREVGDYLRKERRMEAPLMQALAQLRGQVGR